MKALIVSLILVPALCVGAEVFRAPLTSDLALTVGSGTLTYDRSSTQYYHTGSAVSSVSTDNPAIRSDLGVLFEQTATNVALQSNTFSTTWSQSGASPSAAATTGPTGAMDGWALVESMTAGAHQLFQNTGNLGTSTATVVSIYAKANTRTWAYLRAYDGVANPEVFFNLSTCAVGSQFSAVGRVEDVGNGWCRLSLEYTQSMSSTLSRHQFGLTTGDTVNSYMGDGSSIYVWGAQLEANAHVTSYIATTTMSADRAAIDLDGSDDTFVSDTAGYVYAEITPLNAGGVDAAFVNPTDAVAGLFSITSSDNVESTDGTNTASEALSSVGLTTYKIAVRWSISGDALQIAIDGAAGTEQSYDDSFTRTSSVLKIGKDFEGWIKNISIGNADPGESGIETLTTDGLPALTPSSIVVKRMRTLE